MFKKYAQVEGFLNGLGLFHMDLGLNRVLDALSALNLHSLPFTVVQVVGTNGKGSTASFLESLARAHGISTGLFTSPHFVSIKERVLCNGKYIAEEDWAKLASKVHNVAPKLTYFEFLTVFALLAFVQAKVKLVVLEAGLGGRYDATTAINCDVLCITPISMDHENVLGHSLEAIAYDKAGAIKPNMSVYCAWQNIEVMNILQVAVHEKNAKLVPIDTKDLNEYISSFTLSLHGVHQIANAHLALETFRHILKNLDVESKPEKIINGLEKAFIAGRLQFIDTNENNIPQRLLLDGAHNEQGLEVLISFLTACNDKPKAIIFSCMEDKNLMAMAEKLLQLQNACNGCPVFIVGLQSNERALSYTKRQEFAKMLGQNVTVVAELHKALEQARNIVNNNDLVLLCGSLYLLGEFFAIYPHYLERT